MTSIEVFSLGISVMLINTTTFQRIEDAELRDLYKNVSFAEILSDAALEGFPFKVLKSPEQPTITSTQKVVDSGNEEINGEWFIVWQVVDKTPEELYAENSRVWEIQSRLTAIDVESVKPLREVAVGLGDQGALVKLQELNSEYVALAAELAALAV
jgi:hypothetical protein